MPAAPCTKPGLHRPGFFIGGLCLLAAALAPGAAPAQVDAVADYVARMDRDHDQRVSLTEYQDWLSFAFDAMDADHDGVLAGVELPAGRGGPISREQHRARLAASFRRQDHNGDGLLDARELAAPPR